MSTARAACQIESSKITLRTLRTLRSLLAKGLGLRGEPARLTLWERAVRRWKPLQYSHWVILALGFVFLGWLFWLSSRS